MKFKQPSSDKLLNCATLIGGVVLGSMLSRGAISVIHKPVALVTDAAAVKKEENLLLMKRGAIILPAGYLAAGIEGNDVLSTLVKGTLIGASAMQTIDGAKDLFAKQPAITAATTPIKQFAKSALGLGCACNETLPMNHIGMGRVRRRGMRMPFIEASNFNTGTPGRTVITY